MQPLLLAGDVGGTKTALALVETGPEGQRFVLEASYESRRAAGLEEVVAGFLDGSGLRVDRASFSVAGPVIDRGVTLSNLGWRLDEETMRDALGLSAVHLLNDLEASAYALPHLDLANLLTLQAGEGSRRGARAVIAPGTGLGEALLLPDGEGYRAHPSEGGNADFAPADALQAELLAFLRERDGHVSCEDVCSGRGIPNVYRFLRDTGRADEPAPLAARLAAADDPTPVIVQEALRNPDAGSICARTMRIFVSILAAEAGNLALRTLATGGVYLCGGIPPRILPLLRTEEFLRAFRAKGSFSGLLSRVPVHVVLEPRAALLGAARYGIDRAPGARSVTPPAAC